MNTVQKNNNITKKQVQELLENNQKKFVYVSMMCETNFYKKIVVSLNLSLVLSHQFCMFP